VSAGRASLDFISPAQAGTLHGLFRERVRRSPDLPAYRFFDAVNGIWTDHSWAAIDRDVTRWQQALSVEKLPAGDRVAIMARNSRLWVALDQAALGLGLVVVPLYTDDRADNVAYCLRDAGVRLLVIGGPAQWDRLAGKLGECRELRRIVSIADVEPHGDKRVVRLRDWLAAGAGPVKAPKQQAAADLATIVYTSGTTGRPKGVMLSHRNILANAWAGLQVVPITPGTVMLSFLPLSHTFERTIGYYLPIMAGATVAHSRGIAELAEDLVSVRPDGFISVPRIFERVYSRVREGLAKKSPLARLLFDLAVRAGWHRFEHRQGRQTFNPLWYGLWPLLDRLVARKLTSRLGGNIKFAVSGGAALAPDIARIFIGLGVPILQGYGLTETSPVVSTNRPEANIPASIGPPLPGVEVRIGPDDELQVRGESVMLGIWNNPADTARVIGSDGWLRTGDKARIDNGFIYITGRIKDIIVLANGEKLPPADMERAIQADPLFDQAIIVGEGRPYLAALVVLNESRWREFAAARGLSGLVPDDVQVEKLLLERIAQSLHEFPGYARVHRVAAGFEPWTVDNELLTPTLKLKRSKVLERYAAAVDRLYQGRLP
jgi:long-chain acyl-CoA synthetase